VSIFNRKNALVGFLTLQAVSRKRRGLSLAGRKRSSWKRPVLLALGIVSVGVFAVLVAVMLRRQREPEHLEGYAVAGEGSVLSAYEQPEPSAAA